MVEATPNLKDPFFFFNWNRELACHVVIKNLEDNFVQIPGLSGATILGDGAISFILDVPSLAA